MKHHEGYREDSPAATAQLHLLVHHTVVVKVVVVGERGGGDYEDLYLGCSRGTGMIMIP